MLSYIKGETKAKGIWKQDPEANIWAQERWEEWRRLHNEERHSLYPSSNIVRMIKSINLRMAGHVARMKCFQNFNRWTYITIFNSMLQKGFLQHVSKYYLPLSLEIVTKCRSVFNLFIFWEYWITALIYIIRFNPTILNIILTVIVIIKYNISGKNDGYVGIWNVPSITAYINIKEISGNMKC